MIHDQLQKIPLTISKIQPQKLQLYGEKKSNKVIFWAFLIISSDIPILAFLISGVLPLIRKGLEKLSSYESSIEPMGDARLQFRIRY